MRNEHEDWMMFYRRHTQYERLAYGQSIRRFIRNRHARKLMSTANGHSQYSHYVNLLRKYAVPQT